jgi:hypothetical protein
VRLGDDKGCLSVRLLFASLSGWNYAEREKLLLRCAPNPVRPRYCDILSTLVLLLITYNAVQ